MRAETQRRRPSSPSTRQLETRVVSLSDPDDFSDAFQLRLFEFIGFEVFEYLSHTEEELEIRRWRFNTLLAFTESDSTEAILVQIVECYFRMNLHLWRVQRVCEAKEESFLKQRYVRYEGNSLF